MGCTILVLLPKDSIDNRGVGLLYSMWEVVEAIIDTRLRASVRLHDVLHGFLTGRLTGTSILELNFTQELDSVYQDHLFLLFLDLCKTYDMVDSVRLLKTLEEYGAGPRMCRLLAVVWDQQEVFIRQNGYHRPNSRSTSGGTQGGLILPTLINFIFYNVVRT